MIYFSDSSPAAYNKYVYGIAGGNLGTIYPSDSNFITHNNCERVWEIPEHFVSCIQSKHRLRSIGQGI